MDMTTEVPRGGGVGGYSPPGVVQVDQEPVLPELGEHLVVVPVHVSCGDKPAGSLRASRRRALPARLASARGALSMSTAAAAGPEPGTRWQAGGPGHTHEEVEDAHVHDIQDALAAVVGGRLFHLLAVVRVHFPPAGDPASEWWLVYDKEAQTTPWGCPAQDSASTGPPGDRVRTRVTAEPRGCR